jgi:hypothetical protein
MRLSWSLRLSRQAESPYIFREDVMVDRDGTIVVEPGVQLR